MVRRLRNRPGLGPAALLPRGAGRRAPRGNPILRLRAGATRPLLPVRRGGRVRGRIPCRVSRRPADRGAGRGEGEEFEAVGVGPPRGDGGGAGERRAALDPDRFPSCDTASAGRAASARVEGGPHGRRRGKAVRGRLPRAVRGVVPGKSAGDPPLEIAAGSPDAAVFMNGTPILSGSPSAMS